MLKLKKFNGGYDNNFSYIIYDEETKDAAIIDTSIEPLILLEFINKNNLKLNYVVIMHSHFDHVVGYEYYKNKKIKIYAEKSIDKIIDKKLKDKDEINLGKSKLNIIYTPGHLNDCICIYTEENKWLFTSDTLFVNSIGRCDLHGADPEDLYNSLYQKILKLPENTIIYPGHDYGKKESSTILEQKQNNYFLKAKSKKEFMYIVSTK